MNVILNKAQRNEESIFLPGTRFWILRSAQNDSKSNIVELITDTLKDT
jgi:hypothetical protein